MSSYNSRTDLNVVVLVLWQDASCTLSLTPLNFTFLISDECLTAVTASFMSSMKSTELQGELVQWLL